MIVNRRLAARASGWQPESPAGVATGEAPGEAAPPIVTAEAVPADASADAAAAADGKEKPRRRLSSAGRWEPEEDTLLLIAYHELGPRWAQVAARLHGRNRYLRIMASGAEVKAEARAEARDSTRCKEYE